MVAISHHNKLPKPRGWIVKVLKSQTAIVLLVHRKQMLLWERGESNAIIPGLWQMCYTENRCGGVEGIYHTQRPVLKYGMQGESNFSCFSLLLPV